MADYYLDTDATGFVELRQSRFKAQRASRGGKGHPHDVCAVARSIDEMRGMVTQCLPAATVDWS